MEVSCRICNNTENNTYYTMKENNIGLGDRFEYIECSNCGCLQIVKYPVDLSRYYRGYFIFKTVDDQSVIQRFIANSFEKSHIYYYTGKGGIIAWSIFRFFPELMPPIEPAENVLEKRILDVGCGGGADLTTLAKAGFKNLFGCDLLIESDIDIKATDEVSIRIRKCEVFDIDENFDIIMLNHSLEHMPDQDKVLAKVNSLLDLHGICIIRIPTVSCYAWKKYKENWYSIDAPRHFYLHSIESIGILAKNCGFFIENIVDDSIKGLQLNKYYAKGYNLNDILKKLGSMRGIIPFIYDKLQAKWLNKRRMSDCVRIYLRKAEDIDDAVRR